MAKNPASRGRTGGDTASAGACFPPLPRRRQFGGAKQPLRELGVDRKRLQIVALLQDSGAAAQSVQGRTLVGLLVEQGCVIMRPMRGRTGMGRLVGILGTFHGFRRASTMVRISQPGRLRQEVVEAPG